MSAFYFYIYFTDLPDVLVFWSGHLEYRNGSENEQYVQNLLKIYMGGLVQVGYCRRVWTSGSVISNRSLFRTVLETRLAVQGQVLTW